MITDMENINKIFNSGKNVLVTIVDDHYNNEIVTSQIFTENQFNECINYISEDMDYNLHPIITPINK